MLSSRFFKVVSLLTVAFFWSAPSCRAATVLRTLTYHQITDAATLDATPITPILCANGNRAAFTLPPASGDTMNRICVINPDGTGFAVVDAYAPFCFCSSVVDISANGAKVVSTDAVQIRIANGDGSGATPLIALDSNEINDLAISGDGTKVFFRIYRSTSIRGTNPATPIENGIYVINANGTGLRQIAGPSQLGALLGLPTTDFAFFGNNTGYSTLRASNDGGQLVFSCYVSPQFAAAARMFGVNLNGSGLRDYFGGLQSVYQATISSDGSKVGYAIRADGDPNDEAGTVNFDGSGRLKLVDGAQRLPNIGGSFSLSRLQLTSNGAKLLIAESGMLFNTDGSGAVPMGLRFSNTPSQLVYDGLTTATMNSTATRFLYLFTPANQRPFFARLDVNPASLGGAPSLTQPLADPAFVVAGSAESTKLSVRASSPVTEVGSLFILPSGLPSASFQPSNFNPQNDAGLRGDAVAGDGLFTDNGLFAQAGSPLGARTVRLKAEVTDAGARVHATAIDFEPFSVVAAPPPPPGVSVNNASVVEGNAGTVNLTFTVSLSAAAQQTMTVDFATADGSATAPGDYTAKTGTLTFAPGDISKTVAVVVKGDTLDEGNEQFTLNLSNPVGLTIADGQGLGTITNDDGPTLNIGDAAVTEGDSGAKTATFTVTLSPASAQAVTVFYSTVNGTAVQPGDYAAASGTLSFAPGETSKTIPVTVNGDTLDEADETFVVNLSNPANAVIADAQGTGTITDNDVAPSLRIDDASTVEGASGTKNLVFTVSLNAASGQAVTVQVATTDGTATAGSDYTALPLTTLNFVPGQISKLVNVVIKGDTVKENTERFTVNLSNPTNSTIADAQGTGTIVDDDTSLSLSVNDVAISEGNVGNKTATFTVTLSVPSAQTVTVQCATVLPSSFIATPGTDYVAVPTTTLTFAPGETSKPFPVQIIGDTLDEVDERYLVKLSSPTNAFIVDSEGRGTITDDDLPPTLGISDVTIIEGNSGTKPATFTVSLSAVSSKTITVQYTTAAASSFAATGGVDYVSVTLTTLTFAPGETVKSFAVQIKGDTLDEVDERFLVKLSNPVNASFADNEARCTITDDDAAPLNSDDEPSE